MTANGETLFRSGCELEGTRGGISLPVGERAGGIRCRIRSFVGAVKKFFQNWLAAADFGDNGVEFLPVVGDTAICRIVAVPAGGGIERVELGKVAGRDVSSAALDEEPSAALPLPIWRCDRFLGRLSLTRKARLTTNKRSVISCVGPIVNS
jgi:hypothetical protein